MLLHMPNHMADSHFNMTNIPTKTRNLHMMGLPSNLMEIPEVNTDGFMVDGIVLQLILCCFAVS